MSDIEWNMTLDMSAFSDGQIKSKLWGCKILERYLAEELPENPVDIWVLGGWYGLMSFLLLSRNIDNTEGFMINEIRSFDIDPSCQPVADSINNAFEIMHWKFKAQTKDVNELDYLVEETPDVVINTSIEHMGSMDWWNLIPFGTHVLLQASTLNEEDHHSSWQYLQQMEESFPLTYQYYKGSIDFRYPDKQFERLMLVGMK